MSDLKPVLLEARGLAKAFPGVKALDEVDFTVRAGEVHALLGENGAGKSTLISLLTGVQRPDDGRMTLDGRAFTPANPAEAGKAGVAAVYQEIALLPNLSVAENLYLGRQPTRFGWVRRGRMEADASTLLRDVGLDIDVSRSLADYPVAVRQLVAIARAVDLSAKVLILDEPTASLDATEVQTLFGVMRNLAAKGLGVVFVTHFLDQVFEVTQRITVLRNGRLAGERLTSALPKRELIALMIGRDLGEAGHLERRPAKALGPVVLEAEGLGRKRFVAPFDLTIRAGETMGVAGLLGSGRTETALLLFGAVKPDSGAIRVDGHAAGIGTPRQALAHRFGLVPEERKVDGIIGALSIRENIVLALQARLGVFRRLSRARQDEIAGRFAERLGIKTPNLDKPIEQLSGGNQQKALIARWLATEPRFLILDEPTRGVDVGAHAEIVSLLEELRDEGLALYVISSEIEEIAAYADRVLVMRDRQPSTLLAGEAVTPAAIVGAIAGEGAAS